MPLLGNQSSQDDAGDTSQNRVLTCSTKLTKDELEAFNKLAESRGMTGSELLRSMVFREIEEDGKAPSPDPLFTEIIGLRMLVANTLRPLCCGETQTPETFNKVVADVRTTKHKFAAEKLAQEYGQGEER